MIKVSPKQSLHGILQVQGDKSITIRALILGCFTNGQSTIHNPLISQDTLATIDCVKKLGARVKVYKNKIVITGGTIKDNCRLDCKNSGTLARLLIGALAGAGVNATIFGDSSLSSRPMLRVINPLSDRGANVTHTNGCLPVSIKPAILSDFKYDMPVDSAQVKSAVLLSGLTSGKKTVVNELNHTRDHTEKMLKNAGANILVEGKRICLEKSSLTPFEIFVPKDPSSASFYLAMGLLLGEITVKDLLISPYRCGFYDKLITAGAKIVYSNKGFLSGEECATLTAFKSEINYFQVQKQEIPWLIDELPLLALLASFNNGCLIKGAGELRLKESDRFVQTINLINKTGGSVIVNGDDLLVNKTCEYKSFNYQSDDHRMIMTAFVAGLKCGCTIKGEDCVNISFPNFFKNLNEYNYALIGENTKQSLSGGVHKIILDSFGVKNFTYECKSILSENLGEFFKKCPYKAVNVTFPFKQSVKNHLKKPKVYGQINSFNFIFNNGCYNTDGQGLLLAFKYYNQTLKNKKVLIKGLGGAGKQIALTLSDSGTKVYVYNRTESVAKEFCHNNPQIKLYDNEKCDILINATTLKDKSVFTNKEILNAKLVVDINYGDNLAVIKQANELNVKAFNGLAMLFFQGYVANCIAFNKKINKNKGFKLFNKYKEYYENSGN